MSPDPVPREGLGTRLPLQCRPGHVPLGIADLIAYPANKLTLHMCCSAGSNLKYVAKFR